MHAGTVLDKPLRVVAEACLGETTGYGTSDWALVTLSLAGMQPPMIAAESAR
jgi:hypothetical protein